MVKLGEKVRWETGKKPLGVVVHMFYHRGIRWAVVEKTDLTLIVCRVYERLVVVE